MLARLAGECASFSFCYSIAPSRGETSEDVFAVSSERSSCERREVAAYGAPAAGGGKGDTHGEVQRLRLRLRDERLTSS